MVFSLFSLSFRMCAASAEVHYTCLLPIYVCVYTCTYTGVRQVVQHHQAIPIAKSPVQNRSAKRI